MVSVSVCVCVCACVRECARERQCAAGSKPGAERERDREREREAGREGGRGRFSQRHRRRGPGGRERREGGRTDIACDPSCVCGTAIRASQYSPRCPLRVGTTLLHTNRPYAITYKQALHHQPMHSPYTTTYA
eukprot:3935578-Rhodomonas_salina.1